MSEEFRRFLRSEDLSKLLRSLNNIEKKTCCVKDLTVVNKNGFIIYLVDTPDAEIIDDLEWSKTKAKEAVVRQKYCQIKVGDRAYSAVKGTCANFDGLSRTIVYLDQTTLVHYFLNSDKLFTVPVSKSRTKLSRNEISLIRSALENRTLSEAKTFLSQKGLHFTTLQISNQQKNVTSCVKGKSGPKAKTDLSQLALHSSITPLTRLDISNDNNVQTYRYMSVFRQNMIVYCKSCPKDETVRNWRGLADEITAEAPEQRTVSLDNIIHKFPTGKVFDSRLFLDSTFNLTDAYCTFLCGELCEFRSIDSGKNVVIVLAVMMHSTRDMANHKEFAKFLKQAMSENLVGRKIPNLTTDGEQSLKVYSEILDCPQLLCDLHLQENMKVKARREFKLWRHYVFGKTEGGVWERGVLACFDEEEYVQRVKRIKKKGAPIRLTNWLSKNQTRFMDLCSAKQKLYCGALLHYNTNNSIENMNKLIKNEVRRQLPAHELVRLLDRMTETRFAHIRDALYNESELYTFKHSKKFLEMRDRESRGNYLSIKGFSDLQIFAWKIPRNLRKCFHEDKMEEQEKLSRRQECRNPELDPLVVIETNGSKKTYCTLDFENKFHSLQCTSCPSFLPKYICSHMITCLSAMDSSVREKQLQNIDEECRAKSIQSLTAAVPKRAGAKLSDRKGSKKSQHNKIRTLKQIKDLSGLQEPTTDEASDGSDESDLHGSDSDKRDSDSDGLVSAEQDTELAASEPDFSDDISIHMVLSDGMIPADVSREISAEEVSSEGSSMIFTRPRIRTPSPIQSSDDSSGSEYEHLNIKKRLRKVKKPRLSWTPTHSP